MRQGRLTPKHFLSDYASNEHETPASLSHTSTRHQQKSPLARTHHQLKQKLTAEEADRRWQQTRIQQLEGERDTCRTKIDRFVKTMGVNCWEDALLKLQGLLRGGRGQGESAQNQWTNLIEQYKKIIVSQQQKYATLELTNKDLQRYTSELKQPAPKEPAAIKKLAELNQSKQRLEHQVGQLQQHAGQLEYKVEGLEYKVGQLEQEAAGKQAAAIQRESSIIYLQQQLSQLQTQLSQLHSQLTQTQLEKEELKGSYQLLQDKYTQEIRQFEVMENHVEERLLEVEKEMAQHRRERAEHVEKIALLKKELEFGRTQHYFSFGSNQHTATQTEQAGESSVCLQLSVESLLEENLRLRQFILELHQKRKAEKLPEPIEVEVQIMKRLQRNSQGHTKSIYIYEEQP